MRHKNFKCSVCTLVRDRISCKDCDGSFIKRIGSEKWMVLVVNNILWLLFFYSSTILWMQLIHFDSNKNKIWEAHAKHVADDPIVILTTMWGRQVVHLNFINEFYVLCGVFTKFSIHEMQCIVTFLNISYLWATFSFSMFLVIWLSPFCATQIDEPVGNFHTEN
jgi:hypothetical protein